MNVSQLKGHFARQKQCTERCAWEIVSKYPLMMMRIRGCLKTFKSSKCVFNYWIFKINLNSGIHCFQVLMEKYTVLFSGPQFSCKMKCLDRVIKLQSMSQVQLVECVWRESVTKHSHVYLLTYCLWPFPCDHSRIMQQ